MDIKNIFPQNKLYFIGIGGVSMSGLCEILLANGGYSISGSDNIETNITRFLQKEGILVHIGQNSKNIKDDIELVVYTAAIKEDNPELQEAKKLGITTLERSVFLGKLMKAYKKPLCIAGTHGKTTTTSMVSEVFMHAQKDPTISVGGILSSINSNFKIGTDEYFILETCEYCDTFLEFDPHSAIILNIDEDHMDYFKDLNHIYNSFQKFASYTKEDACIVINADIKDYKKITQNLKSKLITYGKNVESDWKAHNIQFDEFGCGSYDAYFKDKLMYNIKLNVVGEHNIYNSLAVCALANFYDLSKSHIQQGLLNFKGTSRRFEYKGEFNNIKVIDDYAHHPVEVKATLDATKTQKFNKLWCVFQPHTYTRTKAFLEEFAEALNYADNILISDIYSAREIDKGEVHSKDLVNSINNINNKKATYIKDFQEGVEYLKSNCEQGDMIITMGAGDIFKLGEMLLTDI
ncbi:MAG: UDP-N-acetylmuramate--L-alanine ligase [bacterium]